jgi:hypothetical protein
MMGGIVKRSLAMATFPCVGPSPRPPALTMPPGWYPEYVHFQDLATASRPHQKYLDFVVDNPVHTITMLTVVSRLEGLTLAKLSEEELVRTVLAGDKAAYAVLYDRFAPLVLHYSSIDG